MTNIDIAALRREYRDLSLDEDTLESDPVDQFREWFENAVEVEARDPSGMTLATADAHGRPSARILLLKGFDRDGFVFFTNYGSRKAKELEENPWAAMVFWWTELDRQVRIQGRVMRTNRETATAYFGTRPRSSQLSAVASPQSQVVPNRQALLDAVSEIERLCTGGEVACPQNWGGYRLQPHAFEFWQGRPNRLHDRMAYRLDGKGNWIIERLAP